MSISMISFALKTRHATHLSWPAIFELSSMKTTIPYNMVCNNALLTAFVQEERNITDEIVKRSILELEGTPA